MKIRMRSSRFRVRPFSQTEEIVLDVLGKGSGTTQKAEIDLGDVPHAADLTSVMDMGSGIKFEEDDEEDWSVGAGDSEEPKAKRKARKRPLSLMPGGQAEVNELRRKKLRLECIKLELEIEKLPLECAKLELEIQRLQKQKLESYITSGVKKIHLKYTVPIVFTPHTCVINLNI